MTEEIVTPEIVAEEVTVEEKVEADVWTTVEEVVEPVAE
jgi:hypothetical protein